MNMADNIEGSGFYNLHDMSQGIALKAVQLWRFSPASRNGIV